MSEASQFLDDDGYFDLEQLSSPAGSNFRELPPGALLSRFRGSLSSLRQVKTGQLELTFIIDNQDKFESLKVSNYPGLQLIMEVRKKDSSRHADEA